MSVSPISTYTLFQNTMGNVSSVEGTLQNEQEQLSSGNAYQDYTSMGNQTQQYVSLTDALNQTTQYISSHQVAEATINTTSSTLGSIITSATSLQSLISQQLSGASTAAEFQTQLSGAFNTIAGLANTQLNGQYLFSGTKTNTPPVNASNYPTLITSGVPDTSYYQGSAQDMTAQVNSTTSVTYNVRADDPAFQQLFAGLAMAKEAAQGGTTSATTLQQAETMVENGISGITQLQAKIGAVGAQFTTSDTNLQSTKLYLQGLQQNIGDTDVVSVSTEVANNQGILQAAFEAFSKINSLQLSSYLQGA